MSEKILKYRNVVLLFVLVITLVVSYYVNQADQAVETVSIPVAHPTDLPQTPVDAARQQRDATVLADMAALQAMCDAETLDSQLRADAAARLTALVDMREKQVDLEEALSASPLAPCVAVLAPGAVTIVTARAELTEEDQALVQTLAQVHAGVGPAGVRVICTEE